jgi:hypothetical protein
MQKIRQVCPQRPCLSTRRFAFAKLLMPYVQPFLLWWQGRHPSPGSTDTWPLAVQEETPGSLGTAVHVPHPQLIT